MAYFFRFFIGLFISCVVLLYPSLVKAAENFKTAYDVTYAVVDTGVTHVDVKITITNTTSKYYTPYYILETGIADIRNISASDPQGAITPIITKKEDAHQIKIDFHTPAVGLDKSITFTIGFDTNTIAKKSGKIWEVNVPGLSKGATFDAYTAHVTVPETFGEPTYIKPSVVVNRSNPTRLDFTKEMLGTSGISIAYGQNQIYEYKLTYHIKNKNLFPVYTEIALPPATNYQDVTLDHISEEPLDVTVDKDGNWLAKYYLLPGKKKDITATGTIAILLYPRKEPMTQKQLAQYTKRAQYWETTNNEIEQLAQELKTPEAIYDYVVEKLHYDFARVAERKPRLGASKTLQNPTSAVCLEFTDLFIAIARAAGIPAREVDGFAYTENAKQRPLSKVNDILHAWPEYYDTKRETWVMVDPTWGNTTGGVDYFHVLDYDHITFVRKGINSTYPIPAGGYKQTEDEEAKDVVVTFSIDEITPLQTVKLSANFPKKVLSSWKPSGEVKLTNTGNIPLPPQTIVIKSGFLSPQKQEVTSPLIPPKGNATFTVTFDRPSFLTNKTDTIRISVGESTITQSVTITPFFFPTITRTGGIAIAGSLSIIICILAYGAWRLSLFKRET